MDFHGLVNLFIGLILGIVVVLVVASAVGQQGPTIPIAVVSVAKVANRPSFVEEITPDYHFLP